MCEIRFEMPDEDVGVIDAYCSATGRCRTEVIREIISAWTKNKLHEATLIMRVSGRNPVRPESDRNQSGK